MSVTSSFREMEVKKSPQPSRQTDYTANNHKSAGTCGSAAHCRPTSQCMSKSRYSKIWSTNSTRQADRALLAIKHYFFQKRENLSISVLKYPPVRLHCVATETLIGRPVFGTRKPTRSSFNLHTWRRQESHLTASEWFVSTEQSSYTSVC